MDFCMVVFLGLLSSFTVLLPKTYPISTVLIVGVLTPPFIRER